MGLRRRRTRSLLWGQALHARFPEDMDVWLDGSEEGVTTFPTLGFGINTRTPALGRCL